MGFRMIFVVVDCSELSSYDVIGIFVDIASGNDSWKISTKYKPFMNHSHWISIETELVSTMKVTITTIWTIFLHYFTGHKTSTFSTFLAADPKIRCKMKHVGTSPSSMIFLMKSSAISSDFPLVIWNDFPETFSLIAHEISFANHHFLVFTLW